MWHYVIYKNWLLVVVLGPSIVVAASPVSQPQRRDLDPDSTTDPSQFYRRAWHSSKFTYCPVNFVLTYIGVLLGETLYIDGGEFMYSTTDGPVPYPYNSTYSLDLASSWSPENVRFNKIDKGDSHVFNTPNMWPSPDGKSFYTINGDVTLAGQHRKDPPDTPELWEFTPSGVANGTWRRIGYATSLIGSTRAKSTFRNGSVHILGGINFDRTTVTDHIGTSDGIISYDVQTGRWQNRTMTPFAPSGWWLDGHLHFVENIGGNGTVLAMGGVTDQSGTQPKQQSFVSFKNVGIFNPDTGEWRNQSTTGVIPPDRRLACSVGIAGDNGTYEVFVHGGSAFQNVNDTQTVPDVTIGLDQVWVLSLPSFTWYKSNYRAADPRWTHTCHVPGNPPRRQMLAIGGVTPDQDRSLESRDPHPQGLGIFDLTELEWLDSYDAKAGTYLTPKVVKEGIAKNGTYPQTWDDPDTPIWLTGKSAVELTSINSSVDGNAGKSPSNSTDGRGLSPGNIAAIVICAFLGTLACLFFLGKQLNWPFLNFQSKRYMKRPGTDRWAKPELESVNVMKDDGQEMDGTPVVRYEMAGSSAEYELRGDNIRKYDNS